MIARTEGYLEDGLCKEMRLKGGYRSRMLKAKLRGIQQHSKNGGSRLDKVIKATALLLAVCLAGSGCSQLGAGVCGSSLPITEEDSYTVIGETSGSSWALGIAGMQLWPTSAYRALQKAKKKAGADGVINITADNKIYYILPIATVFTIHVMELRGQAVRHRRGGDLD